MPRKAKKVSGETEVLSLYLVASPLRRNGEKFAIGDEIELSADEAASLGDVVAPAPAKAETE